MTAPFHTNDGRRRCIERMRGRVSSSAAGSGAVGGSDASRATAPGERAGGGDGGGLEVRHGAGDGVVHRRLHRRLRGAHSASQLRYEMK